MIEPVVSIIIVHYNTLDLLLQCLNSLYDSESSLEFETIVVDNDPSEGYEKSLRDKFPDLRYFASETNMGFGRANNFGMASARGKFFLLLNPDTIVSPGTISKCLRHLSENHSAGMLGCKLVNAKGQYEPSFFPFLKNNALTHFMVTNPITFTLNSVKGRFKFPDKPIKVGDVSGAFMLLRKEVFEATGGFDPDFFLFCEETEWCRERINPIYDILYYPSAEVIHLGGQSGQSDQMFIQSKLSLSLLWFKKGAVQFLLYLLISYLNCFIMVILLPVSQKENKDLYVSQLNAYIKISPRLIKSLFSRDKRYLIRMI